MLQQTQVARVVPRYHEFLDVFPTPTACAAAPIADVVHHWAGLGYNRRAINLHRAAVCVVDDHGGRVPDQLDALLALPGIGPYTARAVLVFAFERDEAIVDTNVARVLARWSGRPLGGREVQQLADRAVPRGRAWEWNQGLLDLGATVCTKRAPRCSACPAWDVCSWRGIDGPDPSVGSAGVPRGQSRFEGSDRQGRGRLVDALRAHGSIDRRQLAVAAGWPDDVDRAHRIADSLVTDGLAEWSPNGALRFP
jgi:A/G-specific adenine glycosylase